MNPFVVHCKKDKYDVYVGRPSEWGNPFPLTKEEDREKVLEQYTNWLYTQDELLKKIPSLKGKILGCWCAPRMCHADVLAELANST